VKAIFKVLVLWTMLLTLPLQGFAAATMSCCPPPSAAAGHCHDQDGAADGMVEGGHASTARTDHVHAGPGAHTDHHTPAHHHGKCATCGSCASCVPMAPALVAAIPAPASPSIAMPFDQHTLTSVDLAHPERPPRA
jgi:hypothetical protein